MAKKKTFDDLSITRKLLPEGVITGYRVYKDATNFIAVKAATASEALKASGLTNAHRIERETLDKMPVLGMKMKDDVPEEKPKAPAQSE